MMFSLIPPDVEHGAVGGNAMFPDNLPFFFCYLLSETIYDRFLKNESHAGYFIICWKQVTYKT